jgi:hypothetical protein
MRKSERKSMEEMIRENPYRIVGNAYDLFYRETTTDRIIERIFTVIIAGGGILAIIAGILGLIITAR